MRTTLSRGQALVLAWALIAAIQVWLFRAEIAGLRFADVDDMMRLLEVKDWLGGQGWFDVTQYRIGPHGIPMHWSRLVDLPLAAVIAPLAPLIGETMAEQAAITIVPIVTMGAAMAAAALAIRRLIGPGVAAAVIGAALLVLAPSVWVQLHPTRIDHHGWQIASAGFAFACLLGRSAWRGGLLAGLAASLYLNISLEGLPFAAAAGATTGLLWAIGRDRPGRLLGYLAGLAAGSALLLALVAPIGRWSIAWCDVVLPQHVLAFSIAALGAPVAVRLTATRGPIVRLAALAIVGVCAAAVLGATAPRCIAGPFGALGPLSTRLWLGHVNEGLPIWRQSLPEAITIVGFPLVGLAGTVAALRRADGREATRRWATALLLLVAALATGILVRRAAGVAHLIAVPGALALIEPLRARFAAKDSAAVRVLGEAAAILLLSPLMPVFVAAAFMPADKPGPVPAPAACDINCGMARIGALKPSGFFTSIDLGPRLVLATHHHAYTGAYHRSGAAMEATIRAFTSPPAAARPLVMASAADYLLIAPDSGESKVYAAAAPHGLMAQLEHGHVPAWLQPIATGTHELSLYRVVDTVRSRRDPPPAD